MKKAETILVSVYNKSVIPKMTRILNKYKVEIISTGGTKKTLEKQGFKVIGVEKDH